jgi:hypothetical protein
MPRDRVSGLRQIVPSTFTSKARWLSALPKTEHDVKKPE